MAIRHAPAPPVPLQAEAAEAAATPPVSTMEFRAAWDDYCACSIALGRGAPDPYELIALARHKFGGTTLSGDDWMALLDHMHNTLIRALATRDPNMRALVHQSAQALDRRRHRRPVISTPNRTARPHARRRRATAGRRARGAPSDEPSDGPEPPRGRRQRDLTGGGVR
jgi:hypothetical protein